MALAKTQQSIVDRLKFRGPQSVKILANQLGITTMGARQHLQDLVSKGYVRLSPDAERQTRGRPVHYWSLTDQGHAIYPDSHKDLALELIDLVSQEANSSLLKRLVEQRSTRQKAVYQAALKTEPVDTAARLKVLAQLRSQDGFMAEVRLLPVGWLFIQNHCPVAEAAASCKQFCSAELAIFRDLLGPNVHVERADHLLEGARRCTYKVTPRSI